MSSKTLLVSIIIQMHNAEDYIAHTLTSVLVEKEIPLEVIVVDDKSTDHSLTKVLEYPDKRIRVIPGPGRGIPASMNAGLAETKGAIVMRCDADDLYPEGRIRQQLEWLNNNPDYIAVCGSFSTIDSKGRLVSNLQCGSVPSEITEELQQGFVRTHLNTYAIRAESLKNIGGFRDFFEMGGDLDLQLRLSEVGRIAYVPQMHYFWRLHSSSIVHSRNTTLREFFEKSATDFQKQRRTQGKDQLQLGIPPAKPLVNSFSSANSADTHIQEMLIGRAWQEHVEGKKIRALSTGLRALCAAPGRLKAWKSMLALLVKSSEPAKKS